MTVGPSQAPMAAIETAVSLMLAGFSPPKPLALKVYWQDCVKALRMMTDYSQRPVRCLMVC